MLIIWFIIIYSSQVRTDLPVLSRTRLLPSLLSSCLSQAKLPSSRCHWSSSSRCCSRWSCRSCRGPSCCRWSCRRCCWGSQASCWARSHHRRCCNCLSYYIYQLCINHTPTRYAFLIIIYIISQHPNTKRLEIITKFTILWLRKEKPTLGLPDDHFLQGQRQWLALDSGYKKSFLYRFSHRI